MFGFERVAVPGPRAIPLVGTARRLFGVLNDPVGTVMALRPYGDVVAVVDRNPAVVCVFGAERNREVLSDAATFRHDETLFRGPPGSVLDRMKHAMVVINGEKHKRHRRLMQPAFHRSALDGYAAQIVEVAEALLARWPVGEVARVDALCRELALCVAVRCFYGVDVREGAAELGHEAAEMVETMLDPRTILAPFDLPGTPFRRALRIGERLVGRLTELIAEKRRAGAAGSDALSLLLQAADQDGSRLTDDELVAEAVTLFVAGHETTAMTLAWTLFLLDQHPEVLSDLQAELDAVLAGRPPTPDDLPRLVLLDRVVKESMRVLAPVPVLFLRVCAEPATVGGFALPKNANVLVSPIATHHDPALYPEPRRFRPDRWMSLDPPTYAYLPFGAGPRTCLGALFAAQALRLLLPMILQRYRPATVAGSRISRLTRGNILMFRHGLPMTVHRADRVHRPAPVVAGDVRELVELPAG